MAHQKGEVKYRWNTDEPELAMAIRVGKTGSWQMIKPTTKWQTMKTDHKRDDFEGATDLYFIDVEKRVIVPDAGY